MSWFNNLAETYDRVSYRAGKAGGAGENGKPVGVLWPLYHMAINTNVCVTIDGEGRFRHAEKSDLKVIIPYSEDSSSRAGSLIAPHPLCDNLGYLALDEKKFEAYKTLLAAWSGLNRKATAVYKYISGKTIQIDLEQNGIKPSDKLSVRFRVEINGDLTPNLWEDESVIRAWQDYYLRANRKEAALCYVEGIFATPVSKHLKGVNPYTYGAKLISCNDETNYTYKGRFNKSEQPNAIGAAASHKAHAMLNYLIATQGYKCDTQAIVVWAIDSAAELPDPFASTYDSYGAYAGPETDEINIETARNELAADYARKFRDAMYSKGYGANLDNFSRRAAVIAVDAATTGRMGVIFYQELPENEYVKRVIKWHESARWWFYRGGKSCIFAPSVNRIIAAVFGEPKGEGYKKIQKQARERLLHNIVCGEPIDRAWAQAAVARASNPFSYDKQDGGWDTAKWNAALNVTCAITRKYFNQKGDDLSLELEKNRTDRDYLYGRLLAVADRIENHARYLQTGKSDTDKRPTNAVRYMSAFAAKPFKTWNLIYGQLNPYIQRLNGAEWYQEQIDEIMSLFGTEDYADNKPLNGLYLLGYSLQRRAFNINNNEEEAIDEPDEQD